MEERVLKRQRLFSGELVQLELLEVELPDGQKAPREIVLHVDAVCAVVLTRDGQAVMVRQFRVAPGCLMLEIPAGKIDPGEDPDVAMIRELEEEIGYVSGRVERLVEFYPAPGFCNEKLITYLVQDAVLSTNRPDHGEFLEIVFTSPQEMVAMACDGRLEDAKSIAAILIAARRLHL